jgi:CDP-glucose 4,6-dehydratase
MEGMEMRERYNKFWRNKRVLVTGFEGFLGSNLVKALIKRRSRVVGLDIKTFRKKTTLCGKDYEKIRVYKGSVVNRALVRAVLRKHSPDVIFHLAAEAIVGCSRTNPLKAFRSNIAGTWEVLEAARLHGKVEAIIVASSDKAYGSHKKLPYSEDAPLVADHPYDVSKSCADLIAHTYFNSYGLPVSVTRCGNIYGPGDFNFSRIVPDAMRSIILNRTLKVRSDGTFVRDYVYVEDIVAGYIKIAEQMKRKNICGEAFNLSDEKPMTVIGLLGEIDKLDFCGKSLKYKIMNTAECEIRKQYLCAEKARRILGWKPNNSLSAGLMKTAKWYTGYFK